MDDKSQSFSKQSSTSAKGFNAETMAETYLKNKGYTLVKRNFRYGKVGEIDLIFKDKNTLVFVEVKARATKDFGEPEASIDYRKQKKLQKVAEAYYYVNDLHDQESRFDIVAIDFTIKPPEIRHIINAIFY